MPQRLSFQLYCARNHPPLADTLAMLARTGYREVEGFRGVYDDPAALRAALDQNGLTMPSGHFSIEMLEDERRKVLATAATLGMRQIICPYLVPEARPKTAAGWRRFGKRLATIGEWVRGEGYGFGWHNHDFEFAKLPNGGTAHEVIFDAAPMLDWECDVAWIVRGKAKPLPLIKAYAGSITAVHVKDMAPKGECLDEDGWADVGSGVMDWPKLMAALQSTRATLYIMEHDNPNSLERFARNSFTFLNSI